jgi:hypothetical protein
MVNKCFDSTAAFFDAFNDLGGAYLPELMELASRFPAEFFELISAQAAGNDSEVDRILTRRTEKVGLQ